MATLIRKRNDPSPRTPHLTRPSNFADCVELDLEQDGHRTWGFGMYCCTYESDSDWDESIRRLRIHTEKTMKSAGSSYSYVFDGKIIFNCATTS